MKHQPDIVRPPAAPIEELVSTYRAGRPLALLFDFDGTLSPIVDVPHLAVLAPGALPVLERLAELPRVVVGLISGRMIDDLKQRARIPAAWFVGTSGLEMERRGERTQYGDCATVASLLSRIAARLQELLSEYPGTWLEGKPLGLTLHYRHVAAKTVPEFEAAARRIIREFINSVLVASGPAAIEVVPALGVTKGTAVRALCLQPGVHSVPVFAGDSENDLTAFEATDSLGGLTIGVGRHAQYPVRMRLNGPADLIDWLRDLLRRLNTDQC